MIPCEVRGRKTSFEGRNLTFPLVFLDLFDHGCPLPHSGGASILLDIVLGEHLGCSVHLYGGASMHIWSNPMNLGASLEKDLGGLHCFYQDLFDFLPFHDKEDS
jgi:hypothetical protein